MSGKLKCCTAGLLMAALLAGEAAIARPAPQGRDLLTATEASQIRNATSANARISLFLDFAADRLRQFQHELQIKSTGPLRADFLNDLLDSFTACVDSASDRVDNGLNNGMDVRAGIRDVRKRVPRFLAELKTIKKKGVEIKLYKYALSDAIADLRGDLRDAEKAEKQLKFNSPGRSRHGRGRD